MAADPHTDRRSRWRSLLAVGIALPIVVAIGLVVTVLRRDDTCRLPGDDSEPPLRWGVTALGLPTDFGAVDQVAAELGSYPDTVMWYASWTLDEDFPASAAATTAAAGATPQITWEPWDPAAGADQQTYPLAGIAAGDFDDYVGRWAAQIAAYGQPVELRFAHEMNADFYPWSEVDGRNPPGSYVDAWRRVHHVFAEAGADNVTWIWSPNVPFPQTTDLASLYPGDDYVDAVALDGYNWSTVLPETTWQSFDAIFAPGIDELRELTSRPVFIGEVASAEQGGDKAAWVSDMFDILQARSDICGFTWFHIAKETDWRIDSSTESLAAFRAGLTAAD
jgi:hypothetical protein